MAIDRETARPAEAVGQQLVGDLHGSVWAVAVADLADGGVLIAAGDTAGQILRWDGVTGELRGKPIPTRRGVVRSMTTVMLPDGRVLLASAGGDGEVQLWDGNSGKPTGVTIAPQAGPVWSMATVTAPDQSILLFTGGDDGQIRRWDPVTGEAVGAPFGDHSGPVRAMVTAPLIDGRLIVLTGGDDGTVRRWEAATGHPLGPPVSGHTGAIWGMAAARLPSGESVLVTSGNDGVLCRWDADTGAPLGPPVRTGGGALPAVTAVTQPSGRPLLVSGSTDGWLYCWDAATGAPVGRPLSTPGRGVQSLATMNPPDGQIMLVAGGSDGTVILQPCVWVESTEPRTSAPTLVDSIQATDLLGRRILAAHLGTLLTELAEDTASMSAVVHVDGRWGAGKSTLVELLLRDAQAHGPTWADPVVVRYEAWRESMIAPGWWSLSSAIVREVRASRSRWTRAFMLGWCLAVRTAKSPTSMVALALLGLGLMVALVAPSPDWRTVGAALTTAAALFSLAQAAGRALFWHSPPFGNLHLRTEDNPLGQVADLIGWLRRWVPRDPTRQRHRDMLAGAAMSCAIVAATALTVAIGDDRLGASNGFSPVGATAALSAVAVAVWHLRWCQRLPGHRRPILLVIDDLDRCPAERVVSLLETVHTILRGPAPAGPAGWRAPARLYVLVLADGRWIRQAFASTFADFECLGSATHDLGSDFAQKVFDHTLLVPDLTGEQAAEYLAALINSPTGAELKSSDEDTDSSPGGAAARDAIESANPKDLRSPQLDRALADPALTTADREALEIARVRREATPVVTAARSEHLLQAYAALMPANPRLVKRIANAFGMLLAIKSHTRHTEEGDAIARSAILLVRFPMLADRLRTDHAATHRDAASDPDELWQRPDVRQVLGTHSPHTLARCLGRTATETDPAGAGHRTPDSNGSQD